MQKPLRPAPFVLISSSHGPMIINRNDYRPKDNCGVSAQIMRNSCYEQSNVDIYLTLLNARHLLYGDGVVAIDCGANIGVYTLEMAKTMQGWGSVISFEAQEKVYYALAGNVILNNCLNVTAKLCAVGAECGKINIPEVNYLLPSNFGGFELKPRENGEFIGQPIDYSTNSKSVDMVTIDSLNLERLDFLKIDVEGMEVEVLQGAKNTIEKYHPQMIIEILKSDGQKIMDGLTNMGYTIHKLGQVDIVAIHKSDTSIQNVIAMTKKMQGLDPENIPT